jgi:hypothetical protein
MVKVKDWPPHIEKIRKVLNPPPTACFTYGDKIYNPSGNELTPDILIHEGVHEKQQSAMGVEAWWNLYLSDLTFRQTEEVEAYATQYNWVKKKGRAKIVKMYLDHLADLLSRMYGLEIDSFQALTLIRSKAKDLLL